MANSARGAFAINSRSRNHVGTTPTNPVTSTNRIMSPNATMPGEPCATSAGMRSSLTATAAKPATTQRT